MKKDCVIKVTQHIYRYLRLKIHNIYIFLAFQSCRKAERNAASQVDKCREEPQGCTTTTPAVTGNTTASGVTAANGTTVAINGTTSNGTTANGTTIATSTTPATIEGNLTQTEAVAELATANKLVLFLLFCTFSLK